MEGRSPFHADKSHFSHRLVEMGLKPRNAVLTIHLATLTTGLGALLLHAVPVVHPWCLDAQCATQTRMRTWTLYLLV